MGAVDLYSGALELVQSLAIRIYKRECSISNGRWYTSVVFVRLYSNCFFVVRTCLHKRLYERNWSNGSVRNSPHSYNFGATVHDTTIVSTSGIVCAFMLHERNWRNGSVRNSPHSYNFGATVHDTTIVSTSGIVCAFMLYERNWSKGSVRNSPHSYNFGTTVHDTTIVTIVCAFTQRNNFVRK